MPKTPTKRTYDDFDAAYAYFNKRLFGGRLPPCLITVRPHRGAYGYFCSERFGSRDGNEVHDEIALNIRHFEKRSPCEILSTLVHEMVHLEQAHFGSPSRNGYHNREWAQLVHLAASGPGKEWRTTSYLTGRSTKPCARAASRCRTMTGSGKTRSPERSARSLTRVRLARTRFGASKTCRCTAGSAISQR
jgi:SprT-like family